MLWSQTRVSLRCEVSLPPGTQRGLLHQWGHRAWPVWEHEVGRHRTIVPASNPSEVPAGLLGGSLNEDAVFPSFSFVYFKFSPPFRRTIQNLLLGPLARHRSELSYRKISKVLQVLINIVCKLLLVSVYVPICPSHSLSIHPSFYPTCLLTDLSLQASKRIFFFHMLMEHF